MEKFDSSNNVQPNGNGIVHSEITAIKPRKTTAQTVRDTLRKQAKENILLIATVIAVLTGIGLAFILRAYTNLTDIEKSYFGFPGEMFLRMLKFLILPLISSSLITGIAGLGTSRAGKIAGRAMIYYFATTLIAVILGLVLVSTIKPGKRNTISSAESDYDPLKGEKVSTVDTILDLIRNLFPDNMVQMTFAQYRTKLVPKNKTIILYNSTFLNLTQEELDEQNLTNATYKSIKTMYNPEGTLGGGINVLGLVMFCFIFGAVLGKMGDQGKILIKFFEALNDASIMMINLVMKISPIGICSLICVAVLNMDDPEVIFRNISYYMLTVLVGLAIHGFIILPVIYVVVTRKNIFKFAKNMLEALLIALATSSSSATLPITFRCIEEKNRIHKMISRFVLPVGATINMDGTALYEAVAAIFIAQVNNRNLAFVDLVVTSITATLASIGAAGVPSAGLVTMVIVLSALDLPQTEISLIYAVDWLLDRFRTMINVWGDSVGAGVVAHLSRREVQDFINSTEKNDEKVEVVSMSKHQNGEIAVNNKAYESNEYDEENNTTAF